MRIDVESAKLRAKELQLQTNELLNVRKSLCQYRSTLEGSWQGMETEFYLNAMAAVERKIQEISVELESIGRAIVNATESMAATEDVMEEV